MQSILKTDRKVKTVVHMKNGKFQAYIREYNHKREASLRTRKRKRKVLEAIVKRAKSRREKFWRYNLQKRNEIESAMAECGRAMCSFAHRRTKA